MPRGARPRLARRRPQWRVAVPLTLAAIVTAGLAALHVLQRGDGRSAIWRQLPSLDAAASMIGLGIDQASVTGQRYTLDSDILDALDLAHARSFVGFDVTAARRRIESLPWIESAEIARVLPGRIAVTVKERKAYAVWRNEGKSYLVDVRGRVLSVVRPEDAPRLPRIAGEGAPAEAATLYATLARYPMVRDRLVEADRIGGRRWALKLAGNVTVELPADREALVLEGIEDSSALSRIIASGDHAIDMRANGRIAVRPLPTASAREPGGR